MNSSAFQNFRKVYVTREVYPVIGVLSFGMSMLLYHVGHELRSHDIVYRHHEDPFPNLRDEPNYNPHYIKVTENDKDTERIRNGTQTAFEKIKNYINSELTSSAEDLVLLERLNDATKNRFSKISTQTQDLEIQASRIQQAYKDIELYLAQTEQLVGQVDDLYILAKELEKYSKTKIWRRQPENKNTQNCLQALLQKQGIINKDIQELENDILSAEKEYSEYQAKWNDTIEKAREMVDKHIGDLHTYNEIKDAAQLLIGKLAELERKTAKEIHQELELPTDE
ncbi:hypothetical protein BB559_004177 [Furculomyces boomerangus]|uniref:Uncharacterized protein n=1 Tax=Furculomyces boomerangus TaxID=61424 RepID=A0A2T9YG70_9FUNG|nr:hypothetical protein BB559_004177 [Furculomyces boomerangus]